MIVVLAEPLRCCLQVCTLDGSLHLAILKYERLPTFCLFCGIIGHCYREFPENDRTTPLQDINYGS